VFRSVLEGARAAEAKWISRCCRARRDSLHLVWILRTRTVQPSQIHRGRAALAEVYYFHRLLTITALWTRKRRPLSKVKINMLIAISILEKEIVITWRTYCDKITPSWKALVPLTKWNLQGPTMGHSSVRANLEWVRTRAATQEETQVSPWAVALPPASSLRWAVWSTQPPKAAWRVLQPLRVTMTSKKFASLSRRWTSTPIWLSSWATRQSFARSSRKVAVHPRTRP